LAAIWADMPGSTLRIGALSKLYRSNALKPADLIADVYARIAGQGEDHVWIHLVPEHDALERARAVSDLSLPLYGIPFAVKDNMDAGGMPTTAACPAFRYEAARTATVVERLTHAGAILIGKTNMDQFATGLVGTRSPFGVPRNPFASTYIPGGSSSGSAVAVASGLVSFALGTDTAGSGRVPAAFNNIVGLKPTRGLFSTRGVVPACRTLDCVSVFALTCDDAAAVAKVLAAYDSEDPFSRRDSSEVSFAVEAPGSFCFGIPDSEALEFFGNVDTHVLFEQAVRQMEDIGGTAVTIDFGPLREAACLLYQGPWVAERMAALSSFFDRHAGDMHPVTRTVIEGAKRYSAVDAFEAGYRLAELKRLTEPMWSAVELLLLPTAGTCFTIEEVLREPLMRNTDLGYYTNFANLLDLCATAVPSGFWPNGLPFGVTLVGPAGQDGFVLGIADRLHRVKLLPMGATGIPVPVCRPAKDHVILAVAGAHLRGLPLNAQLLDHRARFARECRTAPAYRLYELPGSAPRKPGLIRVSDSGVAIDVELWEMPIEEFGDFVANIPAPLGMGTILLESGESVKGFLCEPAALEGAQDISQYGGWRRFVSH
jgi:allophanate hydrolase